MDNRYKYIVNLSRDFITLINKNYVYEIVNDTYCQAINREKRDILNKSVSEVWGSDRFAETIKNHLDQCFSGQDVHYVEEFRFGPQIKYMHVSFYPYSESEDITHVLVFSHDLSKVKELETRLINFEYRDPVTGLFNRRSLDIILEMELEKAKRSRSEKLRAMLLISLENFARINEIYGHSIGDVLLENTGLRIKESLRKSDYIFRFEGKELTALLSNLGRSVDVAVVAQKIFNSITVPYRFKTGDIYIDCHIGISMYPQDGQDKETLIQNATSARNEAKNRSIAFFMYDEKLHEQSVARMVLESDLNKAVVEEQFELFYQPIVSPAGEIRGAEALIRWHHPDRGLVMPAEFIPVAEETGLIGAIGRWALFTACKQLQQWSAKYDLYLSVNLSAGEFASENLLEVVQSALGQKDPSACRLKLEITESNSMIDPEGTIRKMDDLLSIGVELMIDDFGTGQSSLGYLKRLPAQTLKLDRVFIDDLVDSVDEQEYVKSIVNMVKGKQKQLIAEGVATRQQAELLVGMDCDLMQGFYFGKPMPAQQLEALLDQGSPLPAERE